MANICGDIGAPGSTGTGGKGRCRLNWCLVGCDTLMVVTIEHIARNWHDITKPLGKYVREGERLAGRTLRMSTQKGSKARYYLWAK